MLADPPRPSGWDVPAPNQGTRRWSRAELRVWATLSSPAWRTRPVKEQMAAAGVSRSHFFRILGRSDFAEALRAFWRGVVVHALPSIIDATVASAAIPGKDGDRAREHAFKIAGLLADRVGGSVNLAVQQNMNMGNMLAEAMTRARSKPNPAQIEASGSVEAQVEATPAQVPLRTIPNRQSVNEDDPLGWL
jgi:hypothetical protein